MMEIWKDFSRVSWIIRLIFRTKNTHTVDDRALRNIRTSGSSWSEWIQMDFRWLGSKFGRPTGPHIFHASLGSAAHPQNLWWESPMANGKKKHMRFFKTRWAREPKSKTAQSKPFFPACREQHCELKPTTQLGRLSSCCGSIIALVLMCIRG